MESQQKDGKEAREDEYLRLLRERNHLRLLWSLALATQCIFVVMAVVFLVLDDFVTGLILTFGAACAWIAWVEFSRGPVRRYQERVESQRQRAVARTAEIRRGEG